MLISAFYTANILTNHRINQFYTANFAENKTAIRRKLTGYTLKRREKPKLITGGQPEFLKILPPFPFHRQDEDPRPAESIAVLPVQP